MRKVPQSCGWIVLQKCQVPAAGRNEEALAEVGVGGRSQGGRELSGDLAPSVPFCNYSFSLQLVCVHIQDETAIWVEQGFSSASPVAAAFCDLGP